jgi:hypothetical protein
VLAQLTEGVAYVYEPFGASALNPDLFERLTAEYLRDASVRMRTAAGVCGV